MLYLRLYGFMEKVNLAKMTFMEWKGLVHLFKSKGFDVAVSSIIKALTIPGTQRQARL